MTLPKKLFADFLLAVTLCCPMAARAEELGKDELPEPMDFGDDPVFSGKVQFLDSKAGERYRGGLARLKYRSYQKAYSEFRAGRKLVKEASEVEIFERLLREAQAGKNLERLRTSGLKKGRASKSAVLKAIKAIDKALPKLDGLILKREYVSLRKDLVARVYLVIDNFEKSSGDDDDDDNGEGKKGGDDDDDDDDSGNPLGRFGRFLRRYLDTGERQSAKSDPALVREGKYSYRWRVGHDDNLLKRFVINPRTFSEFAYLDLSVRGSGKGTTEIRIILAHEDLNLTLLAYRPNAFRGYVKDLQIRGKTWKDLRLRIGKDLKPHDSPDPDRIGKLLLLVRKQKDEQVIYLDDIKLER